MPQQIVNKCSSCFELIEKQQKHVEYLACRKCFHVDISCVKLLLNYTNKNIDICQICLNKTINEILSRKTKKKNFLKNLLI